MTDTDRTSVDAGTRAPASPATHEVVSQEEWLRRRRVLLEEEKLASKLGDELSRRRRALPWVKVEKNYLFTGLQGDVSLADLFGSHRQLFVKHFMMGPNQD